LAIWSADFVRNRNKRLRRYMINLEKNLGLLPSG
jgi:hypothetical protein